MINKIFNRFSNNSIHKGIQKNAQNVSQGVFDLLPDITHNNSNTVKLIGAIGRDISSAESRLILGATALMTQPFIDAHNKDVDEQTRRVSVCRTIAKIIVGTTTGFLVRKGSIKLIKNLSQVPEKNVPKYKTIFTPKNARATDKESYKQYHNALGTVAALLVMMFTNFAVDAPLTKLLTNTLVNKSGGEK